MLTALLIVCAASPLRARALPDARRWSVPLAAPPAGAPVIVDDVVAVPLQKGTSAHRLSSGEPLWMVPLVAEQPLAADGGRVLVTTADAIQALDAVSGEIVWRLAAGSPVTAPPLAHAGWVVAAAAGDLMAIRGADGHVLWRKHVGPMEVRPALDGNLLIAAVADGRVVALDLQTGDERWTRPLGAQLTEPFVIGGRVYVGTTDKVFLCLFASNGRVEWRWPIGALARGRAVADDRRVYFASMDNMLRAVNRGSGNLEWWLGLPYRPAAGPVLLDGAVTVPASTVRALPVVNAASGRPAGEVTFPELLAFPPVFATDSGGSPVAVVVTGNLQEEWLLTLMEPSALPSLDVIPLEALPGEIVPLPT